MEEELNAQVGLAQLIDEQRAGLLSRWREQLRELPSARGLDTPTLNDHIPLLLGELSAALRALEQVQVPEVPLDSPPVHGLQRYEDGFDIVEVVSEYNLLRGCIHDLADAHGIAVRGPVFHVLNRVFDEAIGLAVQTFAEQQARSLQKRREDYLSFVAHDLRTPLNAISLSASALDGILGGPEVPTRTVRMLKTLRRNVGHLRALVEKVLEENENVGSEAGLRLVRRHLDLWPLVESLIYDLKPLTSGESVTLVNDVPVDLNVYADASLLQRVLQNLVANAIKHTPNGEIVVAARELEADGAIECTVSDSGTGISESHLAVLFEKLEGDAAREGATGLGLAIVKTFVEAHGGELTVESAEGVGSTFRFTLPCRP